MPFKLWFYLTKVCVPLLMLLVVPALFAEEKSAWGEVGAVAICLLAMLGVAGAGLGVLFCFDRLRMSCPFCGRSGRVGADKQQGLWLHCESCGVVRGAGPLGLRIVREPVEDELSD